MEFERQTSTPESLKANVGPIDSFVEAKNFLGDQYWNFFGIAIVGMIIAGFVPIVLIGPMYAGMAIVLIRHSRGETMNFDMLFKGFDYFGQSLLAMVFYFVGLMALAIPFLIGWIGGIVLVSVGESEFVAIGVVIMVASFIYWICVATVAQVLPLFTTMLIVDRGMDGMPAFILAFKAVARNFFGIFGLTLVGQICITIAAMMCFIPAFFVFPIIVSGHFVAYVKIFGLAKDSALQSRSVKEAPVPTASYSR